MKRRIFVRNYISKPANFVLWNDGLDFYVSERVGVKSDSSMREHFVGFFKNEADAWKSAEERTNQLIQTLQSYVKRFKKNRRKARK